MEGRNSSTRLHRTVTPGSVLPGPEGLALNGDWAIQLLLQISGMLRCIQPDHDGVILWTKCLTLIGRMRRIIIQPNSMRA